MVIAVEPQKSTYTLQLIKKFPGKGLAPCQVNLMTQNKEITTHRTQTNL